MGSTCLSSAPLIVTSAIDRTRVTGSTCLGRRGVPRAGLEESGCASPRALAATPNCPRVAPASRKGQAMTDDGETAAAAVAATSPLAKQPTW